MFKYNFNKDKHLKYQLKRCLESEPYDTLEDAKFKALINSIGFLDAKDICILVGDYQMCNCIECAFYYSTFSISFKIFNNGFDLNFGDFLVKDKDSILYHNNGIESSQCSFIPSTEYSFCNILAVAINKSNFDEVKKLLEQK